MEMDIEDVKNKIHGWLLETGLEMKESTIIQDSFRFTIQDQRLVTEVYQPKAQEDCVLLLAVVDVSGEHSQLLNGLCETERDQFLWDLRMALDVSGADFRGVQHPMRQIVISQQIFYDGLTKDNFFQRWGGVRRAALLSIWMIHRRLNSITKINAVSVN